MVNIRLIAKKGMTCLSILLIVGINPTVVMADEAVPTPDTTQTNTDTAPPPADTSPSQPSTPAPAPLVVDPAPLAPVTTGPTQPTGPESKSYTYNPDTKLWENNYYTWDPVTKQTKPKQQQTYSYNPTTGMWDTTKWVYDSPSGTYKPNVVIVSNPPPGSIAINGPDLTTDNGLSASNTGPDSFNKLASNNTQNGTFNLFYDATISNALNSNAHSGDVAVIGNTTAGNATSGNADVFANILNLLQSTSSMTGDGKVVTFFSDINGDVVGDLMIDPGVLASLQPANNQTNSSSKLDVNVQANGAINNDINLAAGSGNVNINKNTTAGNATSGDANAVANIVNMMNSAVTSGDSFIGMLNIYGNLDGDILLPPNLLNTLLAANAMAASTSNSNTDKAFTANLTNNQTINNNVNAGAASGAVNLAQNTTAGNATSGNAMTNVTLLNMTGHEIVGKDCILVFVNVLGKWVGMIMDAPGSTAAALGGGITTNNIADKTNINSTNNSLINNNVNVGAQSGDVDVTKNTRAGNATSGDATASVNIANIMGSQLSLSDWFGVLFINVFGSWNGSFGVNTAAGNKPVAPTSTSTTSGTNSAPKQQVFTFAPKSSKKSSGKVQSASATIDNTGPDSTNVIAVGPTNNSDPGGGTPLHASNKMWVVIGASSGTMLCLLAIEQISSRRSRSKLARGLTPVTHL